MIEIVTVSLIDAPASVVWQRVVTPEGVNDELSPIMRMTVPKGFRGKTIDDLPLGTTVGRSWFLLFGIVPFDYDDLMLAEVDPGRRFLERSMMLSIDRWNHERTVTPRDTGCEVRDCVAFQMRMPLRAIPGLQALIARVVRLLFAHRHRRLLRHFGAT